MEQSCTKCDELKPLTDYHVDRRAKSGHNSVCKVCACQLKAQDYKKHKDKRLAYRRSYLYGVSPDDYDALHDKFSGSCGICGNTEESGVALAIDHCHGSGKVRGLLCNNCNNGLGRFKDDEELLQLAINYLKENA